MHVEVGLTSAVLDGDGQRGRGRKHNDGAGHVRLLPGRPVPYAFTAEQDGHLSYIAARAPGAVPYNGDRDRPVLGARAALDWLRAAGVAVGVVTNQSGMARGVLTSGPDLAQLSGVLAGAAAVVASTGVAHVAAAVGTPVVSLLAPVVPMLRWRPHRVLHVLLDDQDAPCRDSRAREPHPRAPLA